ncbi:MAG: hypothetical protein GY773_00770 [Actinomycetia bacterium]|nr:hypothetical protein [Actinomycetes bacterium]
MVEVSTPRLGALARPPYRRRRLPLRRQLRLRILGRRLLALAAALILLAAGGRLSPTGSAHPTDQTEHTTKGHDPASPDLDQGLESVASRPRSLWHDLSADERALAIAAPLAPLPLEAGDRIELVGVAADSQGVVRAEPLTPVVVVLSVSPEVIVVAIPTLTAPRVIEYQALGVVEMVAVPEQSWG